MDTYKTHTPEGVLDLLAEECSAKRQVEEQLREVFAQSGYFEVQTPTYEYYDVYSGVDRTALIKMVDKHGRILALRPDITTSIARVAGTRLQNQPLPIRMSYVGSAFRDGDAVAGSLQNEFTQAGVELLGVNRPEADAEVIILTVKALLAAGLEEFQIDLGQVEFFKGIVQQLGLDDEKAEQLRLFTDRKSFVGIRELLNGCTAGAALQELVLGLPNLFGGIEVVQNIDRSILGSRAAAALDNLTEVYSLVCQSGLGNYVSVDLGMVQDLDYYTGIIIKGFTSGVGFPICGGGRYDNLIGGFGADLPATGVAIGVERVLSALKYQGVSYAPPCVDTLVVNLADADGYRIADSLRANGLRVEAWLGGDGAEDYAKAKGIGGIVRVLDGGKIEVVNMADGSVTSTTMQDLLGGQQ